MSISTMYALHGLVSGSTYISQINNARPVPANELMMAQSAGLPYPLFVGTMGTNPSIPIETTQVKTILDSTNALTGLCDLSGGNTDLYFKQIADLGRRTADASSAHIRFRMSQAFMSLDRITASHNAEAVASIRIGTTYDGSNNPLVPAGSQVLAGTPSSAEHFVAGPVVINTVQIPGVQTINIDFNRVLIEMGGDGEVYNTFAACQFYSPVITITTTTHAWATYGITGTALTGLIVYLRKVANTGRVADGTAQHIAFTASAGTIHIDESGGGANEHSLTTVRCTLVSSSASAEPIAVNTAIAIT